MVLFGASGFVWALMPAGLARASLAGIKRWSAMLALVIAITALAWLALQAGEISGEWAAVFSPESVAVVLFHTAFGKAWQVHLLLAAGLVAAGLSARADRLGWTTLFSALVLGSLGLVGHAAMHRGALGWVHRAVHSVHLLAAGAWVGSLMPLLPLLRGLLKGERRSEAGLALRRFSSVGHWVVAGVVLTGAADTALVLGPWPMHPSAPYAGVLLGKVVLVLGMIAIALVNRYRLVPRMYASPGGVLLWIGRNTVAEVALGGMVLIISTVLSSLDPG